MPGPEYLDTDNTLHEQEKQENCKMKLEVRKKK